MTNAPDLPLIHPESMLLFAASVPLLIMLLRDVIHGIRQSEQEAPTQWAPYLRRLVRPSLWDWLVAATFSLAIAAMDPEGPGVDLPPLRLLPFVLLAWALLLAMLLILLVIARFLAAYYVRSQAVQPGDANQGTTHEE
jgi:hypothetical protein